MVVIFCPCLVKYNKFHFVSICRYLIGEVQNRVNQQGTQGGQGGGYQAQAASDEVKHTLHAIQNDVKSLVGRPQVRKTDIITRFWIGKNLLEKVGETAQRMVYIEKNLYVGDTA